MVAFPTPSSQVPGRRWLLIVAPALVRGGIAPAGPGPCVAEGWMLLALSLPSRAAQCLEGMILLGRVPRKGSGLTPTHEICQLSLHLTSDT